MSVPAIHQRTLQSKTSNPSLSGPETSRVTAIPSLTKESDADARLRERELDPANWPKREEQLAFGGRRRIGTSGKLRKREWYILGVVCVVAAFVRLWKLHHPSSVVFDEVHFGGFAAKYIKRKFFMDVHPPLAKMLITLSAFVGGFDGRFDFKDIGKDYLEPKVPYVIMRLFPAVLGLALVPLTFLTLLALRLSLASALLGSLLITFENALTTQSRLILLDSYLVFFTALTMFLWTRFSALDSDGLAFTERWWRYLTLTGLSLGAVLSCKWVGLFTVATVGVATLRQLWLLLGNLKVTPRMWMKHFAARAFALIVVPLAFYMAMFRIHFWILNMSGEGDGFMSSEFQHTLEGREMQETFADVGLGSKVSIRHVNTQGGYLHSHAHAYPGGSQQQQITLYPHKDDNNIWRIVNASDPTGAGPHDFPWDDLPFQHVLAGTKIRLEHVTTEKRLHSHDVRPPVSEVDFQNEVSAYGFPGFGGDANDDFVVEIAPKTKAGMWDWAAKHRLRTLRSQFRLRHAMTGCYLFSHKVKLPDWGFEQQEVTCNKNPTWDNSLWYIESNTHAQLPPDAEKVNYKRPSFFEKFFELQAVMWRTNAGLTDRHAYDSRPQSWPVLRRGINFWVKDHTQVYLVGNPVVWWLSTASILLYVGLRGLAILREKRGFRDLYKPKIAFYDEVCSSLLIAWALHYFPFFLMQRQLFLHHYLPSLYFSVLCFCAVFDYVTSSVRPRVKLQAAAVVLVLAIWAFAYFSPLTYAGHWTKGRCEKAKWLKTWDFSCNDFHDHLRDYHTGEAVKSPLITMPHHDSAVTTTLVEEAPEPIKNVFDDPEAIPEEKTIAPVGPANEVPLIETTQLPPNPAEEAAVVEGEANKDMRAPVGMDAGAAQVTNAEADEGGWHGGAEDEAGMKREVEGEVSGLGGQEAA